MYNPLFINFSNLFSHRETEFNFDNGRLTLIHGDNKDEKGSNSNGGGKSTIIEALHLALHGECYRDIEKGDFISTWADTCIVMFGMYSNVRSEQLVVKRVFYRKRSTKVEIWVNEVLQEQLTSVSEANQFLYNRLGISKEDLRNHYVINQGNGSSFFEATDGQQKEIIGRFANFSAIDKLLVEVRATIKTKELEIQVVKGDILGKESVRANLQELLEEATDSYQQEVEAHKELVAEAQKLHLSAKERHREATEAVTEELVEIAAKRETLIPLEAEVEATKGAVAVLEKSTERLEEYDSQLLVLQQRERKLNLLLAGTIACPKCGEEFILNGDLEEAQAELQTNHQSQDELSKKIKVRREKIVGQKQAAKQHEKLLEELNLQKRRITYRERTLEDTQAQASRALRDVKNREKQVDQLKANPPIKGTNKQGEKLKKQLAQVQTDLSELQAALETLLTEKEDYQFWELHFGTKGFKTYLANQTITVIEKLVNHSLGKLYTDLSVLMRGYKVLKTGELRDKITIQVQNSNGTSGPFARYSGGEKGRIKVAGILALHQLSNMNTNGRGLNLLCLDENVEGLDTQGQLEVLSLLAAHKITTLVITHHHPEFLPTTYPKVIVRKENGVSSILPRNATPIPREK